MSTTTGKVAAVAGMALVALGIVGWMQWETIRDRFRLTAPDVPVTAPDLPQARLPEDASVTAPAPVAATEARPEAARPEPVTRPAIAPAAEVAAAPAEAEATTAAPAPAQEADLVAAATPVPAPSPEKAPAADAASAPPPAAAEAESAAAEAAPMAAAPEETTTAEAAHTETAPAEAGTAETARAETAALAPSGPLPAPEAPAPADPAPAEVAAAPVEAPAPVAEPPAQEDPAPATAAEAPAAAEPTPPAAAEAAVPAPEFDVVRVAPDGSALVAGRAEPGTEVAVTIDGKREAVAETNAKGEFVAIFQTDLAAGPKEVRLETGPEGPGVVVSETSVLIVTAIPEEPGEPVLPAVVRADAERVDLIQPPRPGLVDQVVLDTISYDAVGAVLLNGRGQPGASLRIYADGRPVASVTVGESGAWSAVVSELQEGRYVLRVDELDMSGTRVTSRMETPFQRDFPVTPPGGALEGPGQVTTPGTVVVQPRDNLWTIARVHLGRGIRYTQIFASNRDRIRDPDLIYPGQVFDLPEGTPPAPAPPSP